jgi:hypothetical protein
MSRAKLHLYSTCDDTAEWRHRVPVEQERCTVTWSPGCYGDHDVCNLCHLLRADTKGPWTSTEQHCVPSCSLPHAATRTVTTTGSLYQAHERKDVSAGKHPSWKYGKLVMVAGVPTEIRTGNVLNISQRWQNSGRLAGQILFTLKHLTCRQPRVTLVGELVRCRYENCLLRSDTVQSGWKVPTFQRILLHP